MTRKTKIEEEIERTMESIEGLEKVKADSFMFQRVQVRIEEEANEKLPILKVNYIVALLIIVLLNVLTLIYYYKDISNDTTKIDKTVLISREYNINTIYNLIY